jgi:hypothetical protein
MNKAELICATSLSTLDFLRARFDTLSISVAQLSLVTREHEQSIRNSLSQGKYPIQSFKAGGKRLFLLVDVAAFIDQSREEAAAEIRGRSEKNSGQLKRRRGRPTKAEQIARQQSDF